MLRTVSELNARIREDADAFVDTAEAVYRHQLDTIADHIRRTAEQCPIILLSGPSGSGKTTTALMLERILDKWGLETHTLSMDNYFRTLTPEQKEQLAAGQLDLESPERVDTDLLNTQLADIAAGRPVVLPTFDFPTHTRVDSGRILTRQPGELVIVEGIHALNPAVITLPEKETTRLYVSVRTRLSAKGRPPLHPQKIRLLRRMLRDIRFRNRQITDTLSMYHSVQRGEELYIMPYKHRSSFDVDTFFPYEVSVYRQQLLAPLTALAHHPDVVDILPVLEALEPVSEAIVPPTALIREFIGDSDYHK